MMFTNATDEMFSGIRHLSIELTSQCNLCCVHCYAEAGPNAQRPSLLGVEEIQSLLDDAAEMRCETIQFIGGEPTLVADLPKLIEYAAAKNFSFVEVFTNATHLSNDLIDCFARNNVFVATSFYSSEPEVHDSITKRKGSHAATVDGIKKCLEAGLRLRVGVIEMEENRGHVADTVKFLESLGVRQIGSDIVRAVGRASNSSDRFQTDELCGHCWKGSIIVASDGSVYPCLMSRNCYVGSVRETSLHELVGSGTLQAHRKFLYERLWRDKEEESCGSHCQPGCWPAVAHHSVFNESAAVCH